MTTTQNTSIKPEDRTHPLSDRPILEKCVAALLTATVAVLAMDALAVLAIFVLPR